ncbi:sensor histidine kinase [Cellulomonas shaoxiangyii]|uniref:sensor histidine kinase n=1 Tax=Cellulomonas shaoxiangyii TaxID=2566013 RepID=UPI001FB80B0D|nr:ATP-binding protein [Cellulomonas shaoxiangyii]
MPDTTTPRGATTAVVRGGIAPVRTVGALVLASAGLPLLTALLVGAREDLALGSMLLLYLLAVVVVSALGGLLPGLLAAGASFMLANWFLTPPFHTLAVEGGDKLVELVVFAAVATVVAATVELAARDRVRYQHALDVHVARARELAAEDRARATLLAAVGHDLRTPLASTKAAVSTLRQTDVDWPPELRAELLATIEQSTDRLTGLVANLLDMTRLEAGAVTAQPVAVALDEVVSRALLSEHHALLDVRIPDDLPFVVADPGLLERVVENLVANAVRFSPPGTPVELHAGLDPAPARGGPTAHLRVVDHGPGISPERHDQVFAPFQRLDDHDASSHVGLGLAIARGFTEAIGAELTPSTTPGGGLTMTVRLPVAAA